MMEDGRLRPSLFLPPCHPEVVESLAWRETPNEGLMHFSCTFDWVVVYFLAGRHDFANSPYVPVRDADNVTHSGHCT